MLARAANPGKEPARTYYLVPASTRLPDAHRRAADIVLSEDIAGAEQIGTVLRRVLATCSQRLEPAHYWQADIRRELSDADLASAAFLGFRELNPAQEAAHVLDLTPWAVRLNPVKPLARTNQTAIREPEKKP